MARSGFDTGGDVDTPGADLADGIGDVAGCEATGPSSMTTQAGCASRDLTESSSTVMAKISSWALAATTVVVSGG